MRDGHAVLSFTMAVWIGLVTAGNNHFVGSLLLELRPKSLEKIPKVRRDENVELFQWQTEHISGAVHPSLLAEEKGILVGLAFNS